VKVGLDRQKNALILSLKPTHLSDKCDLELWNLDYKKACFEHEFEVTLKAKLV